MKKFVSLMVAAVMLCSLAVPAVSAETNTALRSYLGGDINDDRAVTTSDVRALFAVVSGNAEKGSPAADANNDGEVNVLDALYTMRVTVDLADTVLLTPSVEEVETAPEGEAIPYTVARYYTDDAEISRGTDEVWIAQSLDELKAIDRHFKSPNYSFGLTDEYTDMNNKSAQPFSVARIFESRMGFFSEKPMPLA